MEAVYSKLYNKYTKLKTKKESEIDKLNHEQEVKFMNYVSAADELIDHLRNENDKLRAQINDLQSEVASMRSAKDEQHIEYQRLLMEENQKNSKLSEEIQRLQDQQCKGLCYSGRVGNCENRQFSISEYSQDRSATSSDLDVNATRKRCRRDGTAAEVTDTECPNEQLELAPVGDLPRQSLSSGPVLNIDQPECCRRKIDLSGGGTKDKGTASCMFQDLVECLIGMKLSTVTQTDGTCISALHQSSGYSFNLTWINEAGREEVEIVYRVSSLGTFERIAPEWMREELMFSIQMCPIFFERCRL